MSAATTPSSGWGQIGVGLLVVIVVVLIFVINLSVLGGWNKLQRSDRGRDQFLLVSNCIGAGFFALIGLGLVLVGLVHLIL